MTTVCHFVSNLIVLGWLFLSLLSAISFYLLTSSLVDGFKDEEQLPDEKLTSFVIQCKLWWFLFIWVILNVITWLAGVLVPAPVMTDNLAAPIPEKCCFCFYQPGGHVMAKLHYVLSIGAIIFGIMVGMGDEHRSFSEFDPITSSFNSSLTIPVAKKETIRAFYVTAISLCLVLIFVRFLLVFMARFVSQETVARLSGILPSQTTRSQVAKFKLDHHKMIYKEKRRMSMPAQPRLSDIQEGSESQLSSRNVSKLSTSAGGHSNMTLHST